MVSSAALWKVRSAKERALNSPFGEGGEGNSLNNLDLSQWIPIPNASAGSNSGRMLGKGYIDYQILPDKHLSTFYHIFLSFRLGPGQRFGFHPPQIRLGLFELHRPAHQGQPRGHQPNLGTSVLVSETEFDQSVVS